MNEREKWDARYRDGEQTTKDPSSFLLSAAERLEATGQALDLAGGTGRHAIWLAQRGWDVTLADISPVALKIAERHAAAAGVALCTLEADLEADPMPGGPWDLILCSYFLHRPLLENLPDALAQSGLLIVIHPTLANLTRHEKPPARFLLNDGELPTLVPRLKILEYQEGWTDEGRHEARLIAQKA